MKDSLIGPGRGLPDGVLLALNPALAEALASEVAANITVDDVADDHGEES